MKRTNKILIALLVAAISYFFYVHTKNVNQQIALLYDVPDKYTQTAVGADLVVMDFNNYSCDHCRKLHPVLKEAIKRDGKVRYISRSVSWGEDGWSKTLVVSAYAAGEQGKFIDMHDAIYENWPISDHEKLFSVASSIGLDTEKLSRDMSRTDINERVEENNQFFSSMGINRTPTLFIGRRKIYRPKEGGSAVEDLLQQFDNAR